ncbi:hypothetical protein [Streptomyces luteireticuli]|uniref:hypothetical protein n=1 Tax=Streptomyces luteireticuli TaxID=173858 RepID=UPI0035571BD9
MSLPLPEPAINLSTELPDIPRTIGGIADALDGRWHGRFRDEVRDADSPDALGLLLNDWWRQAVVDTAGNDPEARAALEDAADLHLIELARAEAVAVPNHP